MSNTECIKLAFKTLVLDKDAATIVEWCMQKHAKVVYPQLIYNTRREVRKEIRNKSTQTVAEAPVVSFKVVEINPESLREPSKYETRIEQLNALKGLIDKVGGLQQLEELITLYKTISG